LQIETITEEEQMQIICELSSINTTWTSQMLSFIICPIRLIGKFERCYFWKLQNTDQLWNKSKITALIWNWPTGD